MKNILEITHTIHQLVEKKSILQETGDYIIQEITDIISKNDIYNYIDTDIVRKKGSDINGSGVESIAPIKKKSLISLFGGKVISISEYQELPEEKQNSFIMVHPGFVMGYINEKGLDQGDFFNHSCNPNAGIIGQMCLVALRDIQPKEEITFDYGTVVGGIPDSLWEMECRCGSPNCRGTIRPSDWKILKDQPTLQGYFSPHIQELIDN